jgi:nitrite reductase (NO-forming)
MTTNRCSALLVCFTSVSIILAGCAVQPAGRQSEINGEVLEYALKTSLEDGRMVFVGVGGDINGQFNPTLKANVGDTVKITLISGEGAQHDIGFPDFNVQSEPVSGVGKSTTFSFIPDGGGTFNYSCLIPGHREAGMEGKFEVTGEPKKASAPSSPQPTTQAEVDAAMPIPLGNAAAISGSDIVRDPTDIPPPIGVREPTNVRINLETLEVEGQLADGTTYTYWTFDGQVPGPFLRVRVGDTLEVHLKNSTSSTMSHSVDFHAVTGPGGGATMTQTPPGQVTMFTAKALNPGLFVYHCATPMVADHIANGMYGLILVEPEGGLPTVDREFYVMQGELYTAGPFGEQGHQMPDVQKLLNEDPEYFVFNGAVGAITDQKPLKANIGETVRIFFGVGGPNFTSSFHVIGEILDRVYETASLTSPPLTDVQTTLVPTGGATMVEFHLEVPGRYILVDHSLSRLQRGLAGYLIVEGEDNPEIYYGNPTAGSGH